MALRRGERSNGSRSRGLPTAASGGRLRTAPAIQRQPVPPSSRGGVRSSVRPYTSGAAKTQEGNAQQSEADYLRLNNEIEQRTAAIVARAQAAIQQHLSMTDDDDDDDDDENGARGGGHDNYGTTTSADVSDLERYFNSSDQGYDVRDSDVFASPTSPTPSPGRNTRSRQQRSRQATRSRGAPAAHGSGSYEDTPTDTSAVELPPSLLKHFKDFDVTSSSSSSTRDKKTRPYTSAGRPTASASRGVAARRSPSKFKTTTATTATAGPSSRRPRTAGALARSVGSVGGDEFTRGDPLLQAVDAGELGDEAAVRVLKAKLKVTMEQMDAATEELKAVKNELQSLKSQHKDTSKEATKEKKSAQAAQRSANQMKRLLDDMTGKYEREKERAKDLQAEVDAMKRKAKQESAGNQGLEVRLNRALEERDNLKLQLQKLKERPAQASDADLKALEDEIKQLRKQRNEVLEAFEKALRLVDVLKRQKVHLEAARALAFTEEEFIQALDWRQLE